MSSILSILNSIVKVAVLLNFANETVDFLELIDKDLFVLYVNE
jgi:hypothetical protein